MRKPSVLNVVCAVFVVATLSFFFQNCSAPSSFSNAIPIASFTGGNGDSYGGMVYAHFDAAAACSTLGRNGKPLPNSEILIDRAAGPQIVRDACADLVTPIAIDASTLTFANDGTGDLVYQGQNYQPLVVQDDFAVAAANCPAGRTVLPQATRTNLILNAQDMTNTSTWHNHVGILSSGQGVLASRPAFAITRNDASNLDYWRRAHPDLTLQGSHVYAFSFFARAGSVGQAFFSSQQDTSALSIIFDLATGSANVIQQTGFTGASTESRVIGGELFITVYFTAPPGTSATANNATGLAPNGVVVTNGNYTQTSKVGDSIVVALPQLEDVSTYCTP